MTRLHYDFGGGWDVGLTIQEDARGTLVSRIVGLDDNEPAPGHAPPLPDVVELETPIAGRIWRVRTLTVNIAISGLAEFKRRMAWVQQQILSMRGVALPEDDGPAANEIQRRRRNETRTVCPECQATVAIDGDEDHIVKVQPLYGGRREIFVARCRIEERRRRHLAHDLPPGLELPAALDAARPHLQQDVRGLLRTLPDRDWLTSEVRLPWVCASCRPS